MDRMKIYVFGFGHSGTTILRKIIGDHSLVDEVTYETHEVPDYIIRPHIVFKFSGLPDSRHIDCKRIMIIKNPWDVMGSIKKRYGPADFPSKIWKVFYAYINWIEYFTKDTDDYKVRYEDLFKAGAIESIFEYLGLEYEGVKNRRSEFTFYPGSPLFCDKKFIALAKLRTKQINQPFQNMTGQSAIYITNEIKRMINSSQIIKDLYEDYEHLSENSTFYD